MRYKPLHERGQPTSAGVRRYLLRRFPYVLRYVIEKEAAPGNEEIIVIYAIGHSRRDHSSWLQRLPPSAENG